MILFLAKTALFEAVKADNLHIVETLLRARADPNIPAAPYESPILYAAEHCSPQVIEALLRGKCGLTAKVKYIESPLVNMYVTIQVIEALLRGKCGLTAKVKYIESPLVNMCIKNPKL